MKKIIMLIGLLFLLTGCSVNYEIDLDANFKNEEIKVIVSSEDDPRYIVSLNEWPKLAFYDEITSSETPTKVTGVEYYNSRLNGNVVLFDYTFNNSDFSRSKAIRTCYSNFVYEQNITSIEISTSNVNRCFSEYSALTSIKVILKTSHKVISHNADNVNNTSYEWNINRDNYTNKPINLIAEIELPSQEEPNTTPIIEKESDPVNVKLILVILGGFAIVLVILVWIANKKREN